MHQHLSGEEEKLTTEREVRGFKHLPWDLVNISAFNPYLCMNSMKYSPKFAKNTELYSDTFTVNT